MAKPKKVYEKRDPYQEATDKIIAAIEAGTAPWQRPWELIKGGSLPCNGKTGKAYQGINTLLLMSACMEHGWTDNRFATFKQGEELETFVKKGSKGVTIYFSKPMIVQDKGADGQVKVGSDNKPKSKTIYLLKAHTVFNASQFENFPALQVDEKPDNKWDPIGRAEEICDALQVTTRHGGNMAYYNPHSDFIQMPEREQFKTPSDYYATMLHELAHSTGHQSRLNRDLTGKFGSESYAFEELIAEMSSLYITSEIGLPEVSAEANVDRHAAYVQSWLKALKNDKKLIFKAAKAAEQVHKFVMGTAPELTNDDEAEAQVDPDSTELVSVNADENVGDAAADKEKVARSIDALDAIPASPKKRATP